MTKFTKRDIRNLIHDLKLYSGNIRDVTEVCGPHPHNPSISGFIHTAMDEFEFDASPMYCDDWSWSISLPDPVASLREGHRMLQWFIVPKLHKDPELCRRYEVANIVYDAYNNNGAMTNAHRIHIYEAQLGYEKLKTYSQVLCAIVRDFRSYQQRQSDRRLKEFSRN